MAVRTNPFWEWSFPFVKAKSFESERNSGRDVVQGNELQKMGPEGSKSDSRWDEICINKDKNLASWRWCIKINFIGAPKQVEESELE